jgi:hypothetical protein
MQFYFICEALAKPFLVNVNFDSMEAFQGDFVDQPSLTNEIDCVAASADPPAVPARECRWDSGLSRCMCRLIVSNADMDNTGFCLVYRQTPQP